MIIPMLCVTIFVILVVWFLLPRVARLMIHTPTAISIFVCLSMVQLMAVFISMLNELNQDDARYGFRCCHLKNIWTAPLPPETELSRQMTTSTTSIDIMGLQAAYANLHTDQERDYFMQRYHDVISSFGG